MENFVHRNYIKASDLILISIGLGIINIFLSPTLLTTTFNIMVAIATFLFMVANAILIRQGYRWAKIIFIILVGLGLFAIPSIIGRTLATDPIVGIINVTQTILQIWAVVLLLRIPKKTN